MSCKSEKVSWQNDQENRESSIFTQDKASYRFKSCEYIFLLTSSAQDLNSSSLFTKHGHGKRGVLENKNKRATQKHSNFGGKTSMHKSTSILDFFKRIAAPQVGVLLLLMAYCCLLYYCLLLICYTDASGVVADCELEYNGTRGG